VLGVAVGLVLGIALGCVLGTRLRDELGCGLGPVLGDGLRAALGWLDGTLLTSGVDGASLDGPPLVESTVGLPVVPEGMLGLASPATSLGDELGASLGAFSP
jgi:hypothetical protein